MTDEARPLREWHGLAVEEWRERWNLPILRIYARVGSTNDLARDLAERGAPEGTVVIADEQTRGRGRHGRHWTAAPGTSLLLSVLLRPAGAEQPSLPLRMGLGVARAIERAAPVQVGVKWPNDLLIRGRKVAGLLCEAAAIGGRAEHVVAGIGINVLQPADGWTAELAGTATSVAAEARRPLALPDLAGHVIAEALAASRAGRGGLDPNELAELARRDVLRDHPVHLDGRPAGVARGVDGTGALVLERPGGARTRIFTGTVRLAAGGDAGGSEPV